MLNKRILTLVFVVAFLTLLAGCFPSPAPPITENQAPVITSDPVTTATVGVEYTYDVNATDPDGDTLTYSLTGPKGMTIDSATGVISWKPVCGQLGDKLVVVKVSDGALSVTQSFTITVSTPSYPPGPPPTKTYTITATAGPGGSISPSGDVTVKKGIDKKFTITPDTNYLIADVLVDGISKGTVGSYTFNNVTKNHTIHATFKTVKLLTSIVVEPDEMTLFVGESEDIISITAHYNDESTEDIVLGECTIVYNPFSVLTEVIKITSNKKITAIAIGKAAVNVSYTEGSITEKDNIIVEVIDRVHNITQDKYYNTIQAAINDANPDFGDTIEVAAGIYNERVVINKPLTLQGENRDTTIIDGTGMTAVGIPPYGNNGILISLGSAYAMQDVDITISGFTVQNFEVIGAGGGAGIAADVTYQYKNIIISDVIAKDNGLYGLYLPNVLNSHFSDIVVDNNDQIGNGQGYGIHCSVFSGGNTFTNIVATNHDSTGIMVMQANSNTFDNIISNNNKYGIYYCLGSSWNIITGSTISDNINSGIKLNAYGTACANNEIYYSNIVGNSTGVDAINIGTEVTFDATYNWWGAASGPYQESTNPFGLGDEVSDYVDYEPWSDSIH